MSRYAPVLIIALCVAASLLGLRAHRAAATAESGVSAEERAAPLRFAPTVLAGDRQWILGAIATARPEARRLIAEVDGTVIVDTDLNTPAGVMTPGGMAIGLTHSVGDHVGISLDVRELDGERAIDRNVVVLHELGHVIDFELLDDPLRQQLDATIPASRECNGPVDGVGGGPAGAGGLPGPFPKGGPRGGFPPPGPGYRISP